MSSPKNVVPNLREELRCFKNYIKTAISKESRDRLNLYISSLTAEDNFIWRATARIFKKKAK